MHENCPVTLAGSGMVLGLASAVAAAEGAAPTQAGARSYLAMASAVSLILLAAACALAGDTGKVAGRLDGARDVYLSLGDATRSSAGWGTPRDGASITGAPLRIGSVTFDHGIGTHAPAELVFPVGGQYRWLTFYAGVSEEMTQAGSITVQVWLDGKKVHETPVMRVKEEPRYVALSLGGAKEVRIVGTDAGDGTGADHVCLGNLRLSVGEKEPAPDGPKPTRPLVISPLKEFGGRTPARGVASTEPAKQWEFAMVSGNGRMGAMVFGQGTHPCMVGHKAWSWRSAWFRRERQDGGCLRFQAGLFREHG